MEKFDQPELHPRGFPLWMEILLVSALILTPLIVVSLYQAWQDSQHKHDTPATPAKVTETETKTQAPAEVSEPQTKTQAPAEVKTSTDNATEKQPAESK